MSVDLQSSLSELQSLYDAPGGSRDQVSKNLTKLKLELAQSGLYFAPPTGNHEDLTAARSILELGAFHSLRLGDLKAYLQYNSSLQPFYGNLSTILPPSPNRPITLGLYLLYMLSEGQLTDFHTELEKLEVKQLDDVFVRLPVDLERWLMEGAYNKVYRAQGRVPREEFSFLLERLMETLRGQIASTIRASYHSLTLQNAATLLFFRPNETSSLIEFCKVLGWTLEPSTSTLTFPRPSQADDNSDALPANEGDDLSVSLDKIVGKGVNRGVPMRTMVGPSLKLAQQLEAIV